MFPEMAMAMLEPTLPIWLADNMHLEKWQVGKPLLSVLINDSQNKFTISVNNVPPKGANEGQKKKCYEI
jgi:hypothetical protein